MDAALRAQLLGIYAETKTIAVVGASGDPSKPVHQIPRLPAAAGLPHPAGEPARWPAAGEPVARSLAEVEGPVDVVEVFRPAGEAPQIAGEVVKVGAKVQWLQLGIVSEEARRLG
jgi:predicted CoA-binding protein